MPEAPKNEEPGRRKSRWLNADRIVAGISLLATIVLSFYFGFRPTTYPEVSWWTTDQVVFSSQNSGSDLQVLERSGARIEHDVYALSISVTNSGTSLLERVNGVGSTVRSPFSISFPNLESDKARIISAAISNVNAGTPPQNLACVLSANNINITWDHLDPRSGFRMLVLYTGLHEISPQASISVAGMDGPKRVTLAPTTEKVGHGSIKDTLIIVVIIAGFILAVFLLGLAIRWLIKAILPYHMAAALLKFLSTAIPIGIFALVMLSIVVSIWAGPSIDPPLAIDTPVSNLQCAHG